METYRAHSLILPFPIQSHINPMLQFAKRLQQEGTKITLVTTNFLFKTLNEVSGSISVEIYFPKFQKVGSETLTELILKLQDLGCPVDCIIYDSLLPWCLDVAKDLGVRAGVLFTQSCAVNSVYYHVHKGCPQLEVLDETFDKGLIISWCPQLEVLAHKSIGCFITLCGWNSTLEALSLGVPMIAMPQWTDQSTNAKFVMDIWKMGIKAQPDETGIVRRDVIGQCISIVMEREMGQEFRENAKKWKDLAGQAFEEGGSSDVNIKDFVSDLAQS